MIGHLSFLLGSPEFLPGDTFTQSNRNIQMVKVGINYLFNWSGYR
jgi:outer membrane immunogenic protein